MNELWNTANIASKEVLVLEDRFSKLDDVIFGSPEIRERLAHEIIYPRDDQPSVLTISFIEEYPAVLELLSASIDALFESIGDLISSLSDFPPVDFDLMMLDVDGVTALFAETRAYAQKAFLQMRPIITLSKSIRNESVVAQIESLDCRIPDSVVDYLRWASDCVICCDAVCEASGVRRKCEWSSLLPERMDFGLSNIRMLRCFDREDPVAHRSFVPYVPYPEFEHANVTLKHGSFHLPERLRPDTDLFVGFCSEAFPSVAICPIDNYAQLVYRLIEAREEDPEEFRDALSEYRGRCIISNEESRVHVPTELLAAVGLDDAKSISCTLACTDRLYEIYEPNAYNEVLDEIAFSFGLSMEKRREL